jgi:hypothetical protein
LFGFLKIISSIIPYSCRILRKIKAKAFLEALAFIFA